MPETGAAFAERLAQMLDEHPRADGAEVVGWRFDLSEGRSFKAGLKDSRLGGPYEPPSASSGLGGGVYLRWSDGQVSHGDLDPQAVDAFAQRVQTWRAAAYQDEWAPEILAPQPLPEVATFDPAVAALVEGDPRFAFDLLDQARGGTAPHGVELVDAEAGAGIGERFVFNSHGLRVRYPATSCSFWLSGDDLFSRSFQKRRAISPDEAAFMVEQVGLTVQALKQPDQLESGPMSVLLPPPVFESFLHTFLGSNLSGSAVVNGQSAFALDDFLNGRQVAREDLDVWVDTTLPLETAASPCTSEGIPGGRVALVHKGRLSTPLLDLKYARRAALSPTPLPRGHPALLLVPADHPSDSERLVEQIEQGLLVLSVLGMHTQDHTTGQYSLVASQARVIRNGRLGGRVKAVLAGNFFANLQEPEMRFARFPQEINPGALVRCSVAVES